MNKAVQDIVAERKRQIEAEGWTPEHDDEHNQGEMASAAAAYALAASYSDWFRNARKRNEKILAEYDGGMFTKLREIWPWDWKWWKPTDHRHDLVKAGALIVAEIERLDRAELSNTKAA